MEKLTWLLFFIVLYCNSILSAQTLSDEEAVLQFLSGTDISGQYTWRPKDSELKALALELIKNNESKITVEGLNNVVYILTGDEYDDKNDSVFLNILIDFVDVDILLSESWYITRHFKKTLYNQSSIEKLNKFVHPQRVLEWQDWTPYYFSFLDLDNIDSTLTFIKSNIKAVNQLHYALYGTPFKFDRTNIDICLARIGNLNDTLIVNQLESRLGFERDVDYKSYIKNLSRIRSPLSFQKIGDMLISDMPKIKSEKQKLQIKHMALAAFLAYVKNFPDKSTKLQETINFWNMVEFSKLQGKDYSSDEYLMMAEEWYIKNKYNLIIDKDKY